MIAKLIKENLIQKLNYKNIPAYTNIQPRFYREAYDPNGEYSVAYTWGVNGIIYNKKLVDEEKIDWDILFNEKYKGKILMYYNPRDAFGVAQAYLNYSLNTTKESELRECARILKEQKPLVQAYVMDEIYDKMESEEAAIGVYYAGDSLTMIDNNENLNFVIPPKGANLFVDALCIPDNAQNVQAAELYINFLCEGEVALANIEYINYASPNNAAINIMSDETKNNKIIYPSSEILDNCEVYITLPEETNLLMEELWNEIAQKSPQMIEETLINLQNGSLKPIKQCENGVCMANKLTKEECQIDWNKSNIEINNLVRGICRCPSTYFMFNDKIIKVIEATPIDGTGEIGKIVNFSKNGVDIACGNGLLRLIKVKPEGKGEMLARDWFNGVKK